MSRSNSSVRRSLARSYGKLCGSKPAAIGSIPASQPSFMRQVEQKVENLSINVNEAFEQEAQPPIVTSGNEPETVASTAIKGTDIQTPLQSQTLSNNERADPAGITPIPQATPGSEEDSLSVSGNTEASVNSTTGYSDTASCVSEEEQRKKNFAKNVTDPDIIRDYFSTIVEHPATGAVDENVDEGQFKLEGSVEVTKAQERGEHRFAQVCDFPLKLILTPLSRGGFLTATFSALLEMEFGPLHAALQVGDVILEWNDSSLVVPHFCEHDDPLLKADIQHLTQWVDFTHEHSPQMREAAAQLDYEGQIEMIYHATAEKSRLVDGLVKVIVYYNRYHYYNLIDRNCQHFVLDALKALGVDKPVEFTGGLGEYYKALKSGRSKSVPVRYNNHAELDKYVKCLVSNKKVDSMPHGDLEFLLAQYFQFHLQDRSQYRKDPVAMANWKCTERTCLMSELEKRIIHVLQNLKIHSFRTAH